MTRAVLTALAILAVAGWMPTTAEAQEVGERFAERGGQPGGFDQDGRLSLRDVYSFDNQTGLDVHMIFLDADYRAKKIAKLGDGDVNLRLDSRFLYQVNEDEQAASDLAGTRELNERRFGETQTFYDIRLLYVELASLGKFDVTAGRQWFAEAGGAWIDGVSTRYHLDESWSTAVYGGLGPNPEDFTFDGDRQNAGAFLSHDGQRLQLSLAYTTQLAESELDRHFVFSRGHYAVPVQSTKSLFLSYYVSVDLQGDTPNLTTFFTNTSWWLNDTLTVSAHYARYATSVLLHPDVQRKRPEANQRDVLDVASTYDQVRLSTGQRFGPYFTYQQVDYRHRSSIEENSAFYYRGGVRTSSLLGTGLSGDTHLTVRNNFASASFEYAVVGGYRFGDAFELEGAFNYLTGRSLTGLDGQTVTQAQDVFLFDVVGTYDITRNVYFSLDYELSTETNIAQEELETADDLVIHTIFSRLTYRL